MPSIPDPATTEWVPLYSTQTGGLATLAPHHATHEPGGSDPIAGIQTVPHHVTHEPGGADPLAVDAGAAVGSLRTLGPGAQQAAPGNDARLTGPRPPTAHAASHQVGGADVLGNAAWTDQPNTFTQAQVIEGAQGELRLIGTYGTVADARLARLVSFAGDLYLQLLDDAGAVIHAQILLTRAGVLKTGTIEAAGLSTTPLDADSLDSGTVPDARLSANVALKNINNNFVAQTLAPGCVIHGPNSLLFWIGTDNPPDQQLWRTVTYGDGTLRIEAMNDAQSAIQASFNLRRDGGLQAAHLSTTPINASNLASGTVPDARLSANVQLKPLPPTTPTAHAATHAPGGSDPLPAAATPAHATTHGAGGSDPVAVTALAGYPGGSSRFLRADGAFADPPGAGPHAGTHGAGGADPVTVTALAGYPGGSSRFLRADGVFADPPTGGSSGTAPHAPTHHAGSADPVTLTQNQIEGLPQALNAKVETTDGRLSDARTPTTHNPTHKSGGSDALWITDLAGFPGNYFPWQFLRSDGRWAVPPDVSRSVADLTTTIRALETRIAALERR